MSETTTTPPAGHTDDVHSGRSIKAIVEWAAVVIGALVVALVVKTFLIQAFYIPSESMVPSLEVGDRVLVNKLSDDLGSVSRGDVVVFDRPGGPGPDGIEVLIKRVVAIPGDTVSADDDTVYVNGEPLDEDYVADGARTFDFEERTVPADHLWVMGDNREHSEDSRVFGPIPEDTLVGRAFVIIWPLGEVGFL